jgi:hypothetical protein
MMPKLETAFRLLAFFFAACFESSSLPNSSIEVPVRSVYAPHKNPTSEAVPPLSRTIIANKGAKRPQAKALA